MVAVIKTDINPVQQAILETYSPMMFFRFLRQENPSGVKMKILRMVFVMVVSSRAAMHVFTNVIMRNKGMNQYNDIGKQKKKYSYVI
jgi:hypothetical protein